MNITMFPMGFGESILLHQGDCCLLVDCGSESRHREDYFNNVVQELKKYHKRSLLISHFHEDHMNGVKYLYDHYRQGFDMVYIPNIFEKGNTALETIILQHLEDLDSKKSDFYQIWQLLYDLIKSQNQIQLIQRGDDFDGPACQFKALWPIRDEKAITAFQRNVQRSSNFIDPLIQDVTRVANQMRHIVHLMTAPGDIVFKYSAAAEELPVLEENVVHLRKNFAQLMREAGDEERKNEIHKLFHGMKKNDYSIVFHTLDDDQIQILMTGDITSSSMSKIASNRITVKKPLCPNIPLKAHYEVVKAPHHGIKYRTKAGFLDIISQQEVNRLLISNGETSKSSRGYISEQYLSNGFVKHVYCTNTIRRRCSYMVKYNQCATVCKDCKSGGVRVDCSVANISFHGMPEIIWNPAREDDFKNALLKIRQAKITWEYSDGRKEVKPWRTNRVTTTTNFRNNIESRPQWKKKSENGLVRVYVEVI